MYDRVEKVASQTMSPAQFVISEEILQLTDYNLGIISVTGKRDGKKINKATAASQLPGSFVFVSDGFGDTPLEALVQERQGLIIGIKGNKDISREPKKFLAKSDFTLENPQEFAEVLLAVAQGIQNR